MTGLPIRSAPATITVMTTQPEACPLCGGTATVRPKLVLIDEAWVPAPGKDPRLAYFADLRVDDVQAEVLRERPLEQFIDGFYCDRCNKGFVSENGLKDGRRRYR
jgi:hypothetical protein